MVPHSRHRHSLPLARRVLAAILVITAAILVGSVGPASAATRFTLRVPVLMYHRINAPFWFATIPDLWVPPARFRKQLQGLRDRGWRTITAEELAEAFVEHRYPGRKRFVITIDDGARDGYTKGAPILASLGMHATYYVNPGRAQRNGRMTFAQMRELHAAGHDIANHSLTHRDLATLGASELRRQVEGAQRLLHRELGYRPRTFCYPFGSYDADARAEVRRAGFVLAFTTAFGARESTDNPFESPRIRVHGNDSPADLASRIAPFASGH
jgi:peptidoglycan/xylan/chitin deacetylase (PgdA/CDA1 family)